jgi:hypothetical protein
MGGLGSSARGWLGRGMLGVLFYAGALRAEPNDSAPEAALRPAWSQFTARLGAEWGILSAPVDTRGHYLRPDGSANVSFYEAGADRELIAGRLEFGAATRMAHGFGLLGRSSVVLGSSPAEARSVVVAGLPLDYTSQPMFFALSGGVELQFARRVLGVGIDLGWAGTWDAGGPVTPAELELARAGTSGPYFRFSALARLPWSKPYGLGLYAAFDGYLTGPWGGIVANDRTSVGAFFEWDGSR